MGILDNALMKLAGYIAAQLTTERADEMTSLRNYYSGDQKKPLKVKPGYADDNLILNLTGLIVNRATSRLLGNGVEFILPAKEQVEQAGQETEPEQPAQQEYIDAVWAANSKDILLHDIGLTGSTYGTCFVKIVPDGKVDPITGEAYPRLVNLDPEITQVFVDAMDKEKVDHYVIQWKAGSKVYKEVTRRSIVDDYNPDSLSIDEDGNKKKPDTWIVETYECPEGSSRWILVNKIEWPYDFPPIVHWKNLPALKTAYGESDVGQVLALQDRENFVVSNVGKIIRYFANPQPIAIGVNPEHAKKLDKSPGELWAVANQDANIFNLEMQSDLASSRAFSLDLRQAMFDISRTVDFSSMADKIGQLTNFGLRILTLDEANKIDTKRLLYGEALCEINRRLLVLAGYEGINSDPGVIRWGEYLPEDALAEMNVDQAALGMGIVDKQTIYERYADRYGHDWDEIQERLAGQKQAEGSVGGDMLRAFINQGRV